MYIFTITLHGWLATLRVSIAIELIPGVSVVDIVVVAISVVVTPDVVEIIAFVVLFSVVPTLSDDDVVLSLVVVIVCVCSVAVAIVVDATTTERVHALYERILLGKVTAVIIYMLKECTYIPNKNGTAI